MDSNTSQPLTEDQIHALVDGQLAARELAALQARLAQDPDAQASVLKWQQQRDALRGLHLHVLDEPVPSVLRSAASQTAASQQELNQWWRWGGMAAGVMLAFGVGWFSHTAWQGDSPFRSPAAGLAKARAERDFVRQASFAHVVYS
ncbi:MAG: anti-sigma factor, partial [Rhodoferax sp.]